MNKNPFAIRKAPVEIIAAQAVDLEDYVKRESECPGTFWRQICNIGG